MHPAVGLEVAEGAVDTEGAMLGSMDYVLESSDLVKSIFQHLDLQDLCTAASTCQNWHQVANHPDFWKQIDFRGKRVLPVNAAALLQRHPGVEDLDLSGLVYRPGFDAHFVATIAPALSRLCKLSFRVESTHMEGALCPLAGQLLAHLSALTALTQLRLTAIRTACLNGDLKHAALKHLVLDGTESSTLVIRCPQLTYLSLADAANTRMPDLDDVPALQRLDLSRSSKLLEASMRTVLSRLTSLRELNAQGLTDVKDQTLQQLGSALVQLTKLNLCQVSGISFQNVRGFGALRDLDLSRCDQLATSAITTAVESLESLERLCLDSCNLQAIKLSAPRLKELSVRGCASLTELDAACWQLTKLDMGPVEASGTHNKSLAKLTVASGALRQMEWVKLNKLNSVDLDCPRLRELVVRDCDFADPAVLQTLGDTAPPPALKSDVLDKARGSAAVGGYGSAAAGGHFAGATEPAHYHSSGRLVMRERAHALLAAFSADVGGEGMVGADAGGGDSGDDGGVLDLDGDLDLLDAIMPSADDGGDDDDDDDNGDGGNGGAGRSTSGTSVPPADTSLPGLGYRPWDLGRPGQLGGLWGSRAGVGASISRIPGLFGSQQASSSQAATQAPTAGPSTSATAAAAAAAATGDGSGHSSSRQRSSDQVGSSRGAGSSSRSAGPAAAAAAAGGGAASSSHGAAAAGPSAAAAAAGAAGSSRSRFSGAAEAFGLGFDWLRGGRQLLGDRGFIWGSSGDRLQPIAGPGQTAGHDREGPGSQEGPAARQPFALGASSPGFTRRKSQRLQDSRARATTPGEAAQQSPEERQQHRRRQRALALSSRRQDPHRQITQQGGRGCGSSTAAAAAEEEDPAAAAAAALPPSWSTLLDWTQPSDAEGPSQQSVSLSGLGRPAGGGGGGGGGSSDGSSSDEDGPTAGGGGHWLRSSGSGPGKGGVPALRVLRVEGCERLQELLLSHQALEELVVCRCGSLCAVVVHAPRLAVLELQELAELKAACLQEVNVSSLTLGSCSSLLGLELSSKRVSRLDVSGCGSLQQLCLDCPGLKVLDANFCGSLADEGLVAAVASCPPLERLVLSVCCQVGSSGLSSLSHVTTLRELDLSYTEVSTLQPILDGCPHLQSLSIASCRSLGPDALLPLLNPQSPLSQLTSLDASYCDVQDTLVAELLLKCRNLKQLALSGCAGVTDAIWQQLEGAQLQQLQRGLGRAASAERCSGMPAVQAAAAVAGEALMELDDCSPDDDAEVVPGSSGNSEGWGISSSSRLESLSLVRCSNLRSLCLGLLPASGSIELLQPKHYLIAADRAALQAAPHAAGDWVEVPSTVSALTSLKVGLSGLQVVALALPRLAHLDLSSCKHLRALELRCPLLLQLQLQACRSLPVVSAVKGVLAAPQLQMLDVQHMLPQGAASRVVSDSDSQQDGEAGHGRPADVGMIGAEGGLDSSREDPDAAGAILGPGGSSSSGSLLAAVASCGVLPPVGSQTPGAQLGVLLDEVAAAHGSLKPAGILRCTSVCKVCSKLAQCSL